MSEPLALPGRTKGGWGDGARAAFASIWADGLGTHPNLFINQAAIAASGASRGLQLQYASFISTHAQHHGRHGQYRWIYHLFTDPDVPAEELLVGLKHHLATHQAFRLNTLLSVHRPITDGSVMLGQLGAALVQLQRNLFDLNTLTDLTGGSNLVEQQLASLRRLLPTPPIDLSETIVAQSLPTADQLNRLGENAVARLYTNWLNLVNLCRPQEVVASVVTQTPGVQCGRLFFDAAFRTSLLERLGPIALGVAFLVGGFSLLRSSSSNSDQLTS